MAASTINQAYVEQFSKDIYIQAQQKGSRLRNLVAVKPFTSGESAYFERIAKIQPVRRQAQHQPTVFSEATHSRRRCLFTDWEITLPFDNEDEIRVMIDPRQPYAEMEAYALGRAMDSLIIAAMGGNALSGQSGGTTVALPAAQLVAAGGAGLTLAKLLSAKQILDAADVDPNEDRFIVCSSKQINNDLLNTTEVKSADYNTVKALAEGAIDTFLGFKFIRSELTVTDSEGNSLLSAGNTLVYCWAKMGVGLIVPKDVSVFIDRRPDAGNLWQVMSKASFGATRIEDEKIVQIACV